MEKAGREKNPQRSQRPVTSNAQHGTKQIGNLISNATGDEGMDVLFFKMPAKKIIVLLVLGYLLLCSQGKRGCFSLSFFFSSSSYNVSKNVGRMVEQLGKQLVEMERPEKQQQKKNG